MTFYEKYIKYKLKYIEEKNKLNNLEGGDIIYDKLIYSLFKKEESLTQEQNKFKKFILQKVYDNPEYDNLYINNRFEISTEKENRIKEIIDTMDNNYNLMKSSESREPSLEDYHKYVRERVKERNINLPEKDINLANNNIETVYEILNEGIIDTNICDINNGEINDKSYCNALEKEIDEFYSTIQNTNNIFIAKKQDIKTEINYVEMNLTELLDNTKYDYIGFIYYKFKLEKEEKVNYIYHFYFLFWHRTCRKIVIISNNGCLVCSPNHYEAFQISSVLLNHLYYFNGLNRYLNVYKLRDNIYFSRYTKYELKKRNELLNIINELEEMSLTLDEDRIIQIIPTFKTENSFINKRYEKLESEETRKSVYMKRNEESKFLKELKPDLMEEVKELESYKNGSNYTIYINNERLTKYNLGWVLEREIKYLDTKYKNINTVTDYYKSSYEQMRELSPTEMNNVLEKMENKLFNLTDEEKQLMKKEFNFGSDEQLKDIKENYVIAEKNENKPNFFSNYDLISNITLSKSNDYPKYLPEITSIIKEKNLIDKIKSNELSKNEEIIKIREYVMKILPKRQLLLGNFEVIRNFKEDRLFYINDSFFVPFYLTGKIPKEIFWSPELNKIYVNILTERNLIFPIRFIKPKDNKIYDFYKDEKKFIGIIQIKLENEKDLFLYIFKKQYDPIFEWDFSDKQFDIYDFRGNSTIINQTIGNKKKWAYIEIYELFNYYKTYKTDELHIYEILNNNFLLPNSESKEYLFSKYNLDEIKNLYDKMNLTEFKNELDNLKEVSFKNDPITKKFIISDIQQTGGNNNKIINTIINNLNDIFKINIGKKKYNYEYKNDISFDKKKFNDYKNLSKIDFYLINKYDALIKYNQYFFKNINDDINNDIFNKYNIKLKKKISYYNELNLQFCIIFRLYDFSNYNNILCLSSNYHIIEIVNFYLNKINILHLNYKKNYNDNFSKNYIENNIQKIKKTYIFKDQSIDKKILDKFKLMFLDMIISTNIKIDNYENFINSLRETEEKNYILLNKICKLLDSLEIGGTIILFMFSMRNKETLLLLQNIGSCFDKMTIINQNAFINYFKMDEYYLIVFSNYKGKNKELSYLTSDFIKSIKKYNNKIKKKHNYYISLLSDIRKNMQNDDYINSLLQKNMIYSYELAKILKLDVYEKEIQIEKSYISSLYSLFNFGIKQTFQLYNYNSIKIILKINKKDILKINTITNTFNYSLLQINLRNQDTYNNVKKFIRLQDNTLSNHLFNNNIYLTQGIPVTKSWIKLYEILFISRLLDFTSDNINIFYIGDNNGNYILSTYYYVKKWFPNKHINWNITCKKITFNQNLEIGDTFDFLNKYKNNWSFGKDNTGILSKDNIKFYKKQCINYDFFISDCTINYSSDNIDIYIREYIANIIFILHNLKENCSCIIKNIFNFDHKISLDIFYILFSSFEKIELYRPTQNDFTQEIYIICFKYKKLLKDKDFDILFSLLDDKNILEKSIIEDYDNNFINDFILIFEKIIAEFNQIIERELYYTDFWNEIEKIDSNTINKLVLNKNNQWYNHFIKRNM